MFKRFQQLSLSAQIFTGLIGGAVFGYLMVLIAGISPDVATVIDGRLVPTFDVFKTLFINALKMVVVPLVLVSLICGTSSLSDPSKLRSIGGKSIALYLLTTAIAITLALTLASIFDPGEGVAFEKVPFDEKGASSISDVISNLVTSNPFDALANGNMLQIIIFAIIFGIAMSRSGESGKRIVGFFNDLNEVILKLVTIVMHIAPYGVFFIMANVVYQTGAEAIIKLGVYFVLVMITLIIHASLTYSTLLVVLAQLNPLTLFIKMRPALLFAFSTASSAATLPVTMEVARKRLGVGKTTSSFTLPLGATINMDGTAVMQGVATVFIAQIYGGDLTLAQMLTVVLMATLASIGTAGVPSVGLVMLTMVLDQVGLPSEAIGMLLGIDRLLDMMRTAVNITGDATVACIVSNSEGDLDRSVYEDPQAGFDFEDNLPKAS
ncbi:dicarboxylate/amino acid:cation symporter [Pleionea litopenaei]|uniref:Dicarboxylate/amino acid:cation symporter n=1 Tax=Pleionea litopenaei TaxID=3070815 RepID=A0AA51RVQ0_9GAMM|nr:dicarboxylate/amino acid:cation symporter [Pleionea sp. HL-JVS1]WMS88472.1 dicarboxylate/amino acid:cation symporter [Pleionea sp. HL-JVS1]